MIAKYNSPASARRPVHGGLSGGTRGIYVGDKVICMDDADWLIPDPDPDFAHLAPAKGHIYKVLEIIGDAISLEGLNPEHFYFSWRFLEVTKAFKLIQEGLESKQSPPAQSTRPVHEFHGAE